MEPEDNSLSLVYRDKESLRSIFFPPFQKLTSYLRVSFSPFLPLMAEIGCRFVKYVSEQVRSINGFHDLSATYYE